MSEIKTKKEKRKNAEVSVSGTLPKETVSEMQGKTLARIQKDIAMPGFRKGKVPLEKVREHVGEKALWREAAEEALKSKLESILKEHEVMPMMPVGATLGASDIDTDVPFEIVAVVAPSCSIENFQEVAKKAVTKIPTLDEEKEHGLALEALRAQARTMTQSTGTGILTDDEAKKLGFENSLAVEHFLKEESVRAVKERELQKKRGAIAEALIEKASCDIPRILIGEEAGALLDATKRDVAAQGVPFNDYLKRIGKTEDTIREELQVPAEKRIALDLIFGEIARAEKIVADSKDEERLAHALIEQGVEHDRAHQYVRATVMREKVWELLGARAISKEPTELIETSEEKPEKATPTT
ncbi:MAG: trigger factor [Patescibacteria group bacterium]